MVSAVDLFCGAGGSSTGMVSAGVEVRTAANHWDLAIDTHNTNHPDTDHELADIREVHPSRFPWTEILWVSPECFPADTLILTKTGLRPIQDVTVGDEVLTHQGRWRAVTSTMQTKRDTIVVKGHGGEIEVSAEHPFYVREQRQRWHNDIRRYKRSCDAPAWVPASDLVGSTGQKWGSAKFRAHRWATPVEMDAVGIPLPVSTTYSSYRNSRTINLANLEFWWFVGRWLGDGSLRMREHQSNEITISCGKHEADQLEQDLIGIGEDFNWRRRDVRTATLFEMAHTDLSQWLLDNFGQHSHGKTIPAWAFTMPLEFRAALIEGYVSADGHDDGRATHISSVSKSLALGIRLLVEGLGYRASLGVYDMSRASVIEGRAVNVRDAWIVRWENNASQREAFEEDGFSWGLIKQILPGRQGIEVYNISVEDDESYVADGIVVHNCTNHSLAKGRKRKAINQRTLWGDDNAFDPEEERSRATMREVIDHADYHRNPIVIVENVVDIRHWAYYNDWLTAMHNLGYLHETLYLNAMFFGVPQSRDRWYTVFWRRGNVRPDLDFRPPGWCDKCECEVNCVQVFKNPQKLWGRYGKRRQYLYRCPHCTEVVHPWTTPAYTAIDWSIEADRIADRDRPLKPKTMERIRAGVRKFGRKTHLATLRFMNSSHTSRVQSVTDPLPTLTTAQKFAVVNPFIAALRGDPYHQYCLSDPLTTLVAAGSQHALVQPFQLSYANFESPPRSVRDELFAITTGWTTRIVTPPYIAPLRKSSPPYTLDRALGTITAGGGHHSLVTPPHIITMRQATQHRLLNQPLSTMTAGGINHALLMSYYGSNPVYAFPRDPMPTQRTASHLSLMDMIRQPVGEALDDTEVEEIVQNSTFRMLEPHELKLGMSFPSGYVVLGNKRDKVKQVGNAVACNVAEWIVRQCVESLGG